MEFHAQVKQVTQMNIPTYHEELTYRGQSTAAFPDCGTATNQPNNEKQSPDSYDHHRRDESVHIFKEVVIVVVSDEDIGSDIA